MGRTDNIERRVPEAAGAHLVLEPQGGPVSRRVVSRGDVVVIGSGDDSDWRLNDRTVSGQHLRISVNSGGILVEDMSSTNGTYYLGSRLERASCPHGAVLHLGQSTLRILSRDDLAGPPLSDKIRYGELAGSSPAMRRLYYRLEQLEGTDVPVLIQGETGVGKGLVARALHASSPRADAPFLVFDSAAVSPNLIESELFGHERGAFTGAETSRAGIFEAAKGGTVFIDEIGELPLTLQPKLLRALEEGECKRVGGNESLKLDFRVIAATHRSLVEMVEDGKFREDLYFRLNVVSVPVPPLRDRREDIPLLLEHFCRQLDAEFQASEATVELFTTSYDWPGNVRELRHAIMRVATLGESAVPRGTASSDHSNVPVDVEQPLNEAKKTLVAAYERDYLRLQLEHTGGNISEASRRSGIDRSYFKRLLKRHGLSSGG
ncbi:MAG: sigma 54-interacting transcriptional regulator [Myxococcota bacterium]